ncbi:hypothetical protein PR048_025359 [Dryococelus australis]|uniref:Uncharacterized protein n=1 Tax=Dryococelus australis TaxID=614101 RepID=A0ABQ9GR79_9NEOP|nr:hypothetical protein PR048_025359 [Dryococelus australis]
MRCGLSTLCTGQHNYEHTIFYCRAYRISLHRYWPLVRMCQLRERRVAVLTRTTAINHSSQFFKELFALTCLLAFSSHFPGPPSSYYHYLRRHFSPRQLGTPLLKWLPKQWAGLQSRVSSVSGAFTAYGGCAPVSLLASHHCEQGLIPGRVTPDFCMRESYRTMPLVGGFSRGSPVSPSPSFRCCSIVTSIILIGSQDHDVKSRPKLFTAIQLSNDIPLELFGPTFRSGGRRLDSARQLDVLSVDPFHSPIPGTCTCDPLTCTTPENFAISFRDKIDVKHSLLDPALHASEPIADLQGNTLRIPLLPGVGQQPMNIQLRLHWWLQAPDHVIENGRPSEGNLMEEPLQNPNWGRITPGFSQVGIVPDAAAGLRVFSGIFRVLRPCLPGAAPFSPHFTLIGS